MKLRRREFDIFNLSFLDVISCGFGAVVMLVLIFKPADNIATGAQDDVGGLLSQIIQSQNTIAGIKESIEAQITKLKALSDDKQHLQMNSKQLAREIQEQESKQQSLSSDLQGLALVQSTLKRAMLIQSDSPPTKRDVEVGGIPVDSDYVIFIIDTSGSMQQIWVRVAAEIVNVLNIHPEVKGFQVLNDMGRSLISGYEGKWIPDTPGRRSNVMKLLNNWHSISNSSPVEGLQVALKKYARPDITTSVYVFGDDYTGSSYDNVIEQISEQNMKSGKRLAKIHGVGFVSPTTTDRFAVLMRELTKRNGGTFLALPF